MAADKNTDKNTDKKDDKAVDAPVEEPTTKVVKGGPAEDEQEKTYPLDEIDPAASAPSRFKDDSPRDGTDWLNGPMPTVTEAQKDALLAIRKAEKAEGDKAFMPQGD